MSNEIDQRSPDTPRFGKRSFLKGFGKALVIHGAILTTTNAEQIGSALVAGGKLLANQMVTSAEATEPIRKAQSFEVIGASAPLSQNQLNNSIIEWNSVSKEMRPDTYYGSGFIWKGFYDRFTADNGMSYESFLTRHLTEVNRMLTETNPPTRVGYNLRRLVILQDGVESPASYHSGYLQNGIKDSDGTIRMIQDSQLAIENGSYFFRRDAYYNSQKDISYAFIRELIVLPSLHLTDIWVMNYPGIFNLSSPTSVITDLPTQWQGYETVRSDIAQGDIMTEGSMPDTGWRFALYTASQLARRPDPHAFAATLKDYLGMPYEFPSTAKMNLTTTTGDGINGPFQVYRSQGTGRSYDDKIIPDAPIYVGGLNNFDPSKWFQRNSDGVVARTDATFLIKTTQNGVQYLRWGDVRDFNLAAWQNKGSLKLKMATANDNPRTFDWTIQYGDTPRPGIKRVYVPSITQGFLS